LKLEIEPVQIETAHPFRIARGTRQSYNVFIFSLTYDGITGLGEAAPQPYYKEDPMTLRTAVGQLGSGVLDGSPTELLERLNDPMGDLFVMLEPHASVRAALDTALWDLRGQLENRPCYEFFGANPSNTPLTSYTIGFDRPDIVDKKVDAAEGFKILKVKVGIPGDIEILDRVIARSGKKIRVDANEGWDLEAALTSTRELYDRGVEFCEQPLPHDDEEGLRELKRLTPLPIILDESIINPEDVRRREDQCHGINIKLMKCGGMTRAMQLIEAARERNLKVMLGCMIETSIGITAAAHLSPLVDYADLDGAALLANDPFTGVGIVDGKLVLGDAPGLGVSRRD